MQLSIDADGYQRISIKEGNAPKLDSIVTTADGVRLVRADVSTIKATIVNLTAKTTVLNQVALVVNDVMSDTLLTYTDADDVVHSYNFRWQTLASYFMATAYNEDCKFRVEIWVTPVAGEQLDAGWWEITANKSIVPIPA